MDAYFAAFPPDFDTLGEVFVKTYYEQLQINRNNVVDMYHVSSYHHVMFLLKDLALMTYEGTKIQGKPAIAKHFQVR